MITEYSLNLNFVYISLIFSHNFYHKNILRSSTWLLNVFASEDILCCLMYCSNNTNNLVVVEDNCEHEIWKKKKPEVCLQTEYFPAKYSFH